MQPSNLNVLQELIPELPEDQVGLEIPKDKEGAWHRAPRCDIRMDELGLAAGAFFV